MRLVTVIIIDETLYMVDTALRTPCNLPAEFCNLQRKDSEHEGLRFELLEEIDRDRGRLATDYTFADTPFLPRKLQLKSILELQSFDTNKSIAASNFMPDAVET
jgi:hypothetical protein